jgi:hypothetical protein
MLADTEKSQVRRINSLEEIVKYLEGELDHFKSMEAW